MQRPTIVQLNLSPTLGGAEVFTASFSRALATLGWPTRVIVDAHARFWSELDFGGVRREPPTPPRRRGQATSSSCTRRCRRRCLQRCPGVS